MWFGVGVEFQSCGDFPVSTYLRGFLACFLGGTVDQNALPMDQMMSN